MGNCLWKKQDFETSKQFLKKGLKIKRTKEGLRYYSIVLRKVKDKSIEKSIKYAKEAVSLDLKDGESWYILGNSYLSYYFSVDTSYDNITKVISAYNNAV